MHVIKVPEKQKKENKAEEIFNFLKFIINFLKIMEDIKLQVQEAQSISSRINQLSTPTKNNDLDTSLKSDYKTKREEEILKTSA